MRSTEFIVEKKIGHISKRAQQPSRGIHTYGDGEHVSGDYTSYRLGLAVAGADGSNKPLHDVDSKSWVGKKKTAHPYSELEQKMLKQAYKAIGADWKDLNHGNLDSEELKSTNNVSPVANWMKKSNSKPTHESLILQKWNCESTEQMAQLIKRAEHYVIEQKKLLEAGTTGGTNSGSGTSNISAAGKKGAGWLFGGDYGAPKEGIGQVISRAGGAAVRAVAPAVTQAASKVGGSLGTKAAVGGAKALNAVGVKASPLALARVGKAAGSAAGGSLGLAGVDYTLDRLSNTDQSTDDETGESLASLGGKVLGKAVPLGGTALSAYDALDRWKKGDRSGAVISVLAGAGYLVPGPVGWVLGGSMDATNLLRDRK